MTRELLLETILIFILYLLACYGAVRFAGDMIDFSKKWSE